MKKNSLEKIDKNYLDFPLFSVFNSVGLHGFSDFGYFDTHSLFWSVVRLFTCYYRVIYPIQENKKIVDQFMESDIESFIIRQRIILNDIAYIIWQLIPDERGLKNPTGGVHPSNKEMRIKDLVKNIEKDKDKFFDLIDIFERNDFWISEITNKRDGIIHYKQKVILMGGDRDEKKFITIDSAMRSDDDKNISVVFEFVNNNMKFLWDFMNVDIKNWIEKYVEDNNIGYKKVDDYGAIRCPGTHLFRSINYGE